MVGVRVLCPLVVCLSVFFSTASQAAPAPIETYGDSITAGFLSGTNVTAAPPLSTISRILSDMVMFGISHDRKYLLPHHRPDLAWPVQLAQLQMEASGSSEKAAVYNAAISGAETSDLVGQVRSNRNRSSSARAFFFVGHNDLCQNFTPPDHLAEAYAASYEAALEAWDRTHEGATAYLIPIADIAQVYRTLQGYIWFDHNGRGKYSCEDSWEKFFPYCVSHHKQALAGTLESYMQPRLTAMNRALEDLAEKLDRRGGRNRYRYIADAHALPFEPSFFAVDCYHPSASGQRTLAREILRRID